MEWLSALTEEEFFIVIGLIGLAGYTFILIVGVRDK